MNAERAPCDVFPSNDSRSHSDSGCFIPHDGPYPRAVRAAASSGWHQNEETFFILIRDLHQLAVATNLLHRQ
jgi:hypothetical protein